MYTRRIPSIMTRCFYLLTYLFSNYTDATHVTQVQQSQQNFSEVILHVWHVIAISVTQVSRYIFRCFH